MKARTILVIAIILGLGSVQAFAAAAAVQKKPTAAIQKKQIQIRKMVLNKNVVLAMGTGVQGTLSIQGTLPSQLTSMTCSDIKVYIGTWSTPPPPPDGLGLSIPVFNEASSATATGTMPSCSYAIRNAPANIQLSILVDASQRFACNRTTLITTPYNVQLSLAKGNMQTVNYQVTPKCEIIY